MADSIQSLQGFDNYLIENLLGIDVQDAEGAGSGELTVGDTLIYSDGSRLPLDDSYFNSDQPNKLESALSTNGQRVEIAASASAVFLLLKRANQFVPAALNMPVRPTLAAQSQVPVLSEVGKIWQVRLGAGERPLFAGGESVFLTGGFDALSTQIENAPDLSAEKKGMKRQELAALQRQAEVCAAAGRAIDAAFLSGTILTGDIERLQANFEDYKTLKRSVEFELPR